MADNPGGGGRGNTTAILKSFLDAGVRDCAFAVHFDPPLAAEAHRLGPGARFTARLNRAETDPQSEPLEAPAEVMAVSDGEIVGRRGFIGGRRFSLGPSAWLRLADRIDVVFISIRHQCFDTEMLEHLGLKIPDLRGIVLKSRGHFRAGFDDLFADENILRSRRAGARDAGPHPCRLAGHHASDLAARPGDVLAGAGECGGAVAGGRKETPHAHGQDRRRPNRANPEGREPAARGLHQEPSP